MQRRPEPFVPAAFAISPAISLRGDLLEGVEHLVGVDGVQQVL